MTLPLSSTSSTDPMTSPLSPQEIESPSSHWSSSPR